MERARREMPRCPMIRIAKPERFARNPYLVRSTLVACPISSRPAEDKTWQQHSQAIKSQLIKTKGERRMQSVVRQLGGPGTAPASFDRLLLQPSLTRCCQERQRLNGALVEPSSIARVPVT